MIDVQMPKYKCHKEVWALKIAKIEWHGAISGDSATITPDDVTYQPFEVSGPYMHKHNPKVGGYYVEYEDGYKSFSPAKAFEESYTRI